MVSLSKLNGTWNLVNREGVVRSGGKYTRGIEEKNFKISNTTLPKGKMSTLVETTSPGCALLGRGPLKYAP